MRYFRKPSGNSTGERPVKTEPNSGTYRVNRANTFSTSLEPTRCDTSLAPLGTPRLRITIKSSSRPLVPTIRNFLHVCRNSVTNSMCSSGQTVAVMPLPAKGAVTKGYRWLSNTGRTATMSIPSTISRSPVGCLSPNPPKDTDGGREDSGRGWVRELQGRWPGVLG